MQVWNDMRVNKKWQIFVCEQNRTNKEKKADQLGLQVPDIAETGCSVLNTHCATRLLMRWCLWRYHWSASGAKLTFQSSWLHHCRLSEHGFQLNVNGSTYSAFPCTLPLYRETWHTVWPSKLLYFSGFFFPYSWRVLLGTEHCGPLWPHVRAVFYKQWKICKVQVRHLTFIPLWDFEELIELVFYTLLT